MEGNNVYYNRESLHSTAGKLRIILVRNGEPADRLDPEWLNKALPSETLYKNVNANQPLQLPMRSNMSDYKMDPPLTNIGYFSVQVLGRHLRRIGVKPSYIFSSPSLRCVQTASAFLEAYTKKGGDELTIYIEPGFYEPLVFYKMVPNFLSPSRLGDLEFPIEHDYEPVIPVSEMKAFCVDEKTTDMYNRVGQVTRGILDTMQEETDGTIIIFTHAPIIDAIIRYMLHMNCPHLMSDLIRMGVNYPYSSTVVLERESGVAEEVKGSTWSLNPFLIPSLNMAHFGTGATIPEFN